MLKELKGTHKESVISDCNLYEYRALVLPLRVRALESSIPESLRKKEWFLNCAHQESKITGALKTIDFYSFEFLCFRFHCTQREMTGVVERSGSGRALRKGKAQGSGKCRGLSSAEEGQGVKNLATQFFSDRAETRATKPSKAGNPEP